MVFRLFFIVFPDEHHSTFADGYASSKVSWLGFALAAFALSALSSLRLTRFAGKVDRSSKMSYLPLIC